jgi:hypothetical protein
MGHFTDDSLEKFNQMCSEGVNFGESPVYDFARCIKKNGEIYGISPGEVCQEGKQISDAAAKSKLKDEGSRLAKLRVAFRKKTGRELTPEEMEKAEGLLSKMKTK